MDEPFEPVIRKEDLKIWRIGKARHQERHWQGDGGLYVASRWLRAERPVCYASNSLALAQLETLVHLQGVRVDQMHWVYATAVIPKTVNILRIPPSALPSGWATQASVTLQTLREIGTDWHRRGRSAVLSIPSAISPAANDTNYILNPAHEDYCKIRFNTPSEFAFDARLAELLRAQDQAK